MENQIEGQVSMEQLISEEEVQEEVVLNPEAEEELSNGKGDDEDEQ